MRSPYPLGEPIVQLEGIRLDLGLSNVLDGISLKVACGERVAVIGPSGSGKSSLLRCINGLLRPQAGTVRLFGTSISGEAAWREARLRTETIFQNFNLYSRMTVLANVALAPHRLIGLPLAEAEQQARRHLASLGIEPLADRFPAELSGGQKQRVALARALAKVPDVLLLDEPTSALDPESVQGALAAIEVATAKGITTVTVTHEIGFARRQAHRLVFMDQGRIVEEGPPETILAAPRTERLARFLASAAS